jgi:hypothetical protein
VRVITPTLSLIVADAGAHVAAATVAGGTAGRTAQLFYQSRAAQVGPATWTSGGSAVFDGSGVAAVSADPGGFGRYQWFAVQLDAGGTAAENFSQNYFRPLVDPEYRSVWERCVLAVKDGINDLTLDGVAAAKVVAEWWPKILKGMDPVPPAVLVAPFAAEDYPPTGVNDQDDVGYPVVVVLVDKLNNDSAANMTRDLLWRERISRAFRFQRLAGVPEIYNSAIQPDVVVHPDAYAHGLLVSTLLFRFVSREDRGV